MKFHANYLGRLAPNSSRRSATCCIPVSPWNARYSAQKTPPPSQNFRGIRGSSSFFDSSRTCRLKRLPILLNGMHKLMTFIDSKVFSFFFNSINIVNFHNYPLFSTTSTGSSDRICVTLGNVSSALSTGSVFDRKSNVRFRISSLIGRNQSKWEIIGNQGIIISWCIRWKKHMIIADPIFSGQPRILCERNDWCCRAFSINKILTKR